MDKPMDMDLAKDLFGDDTKPGDSPTGPPTSPRTPEAVPQADGLSPDDLKPATDTAMPDKFKDKSKEDILASYLELEKNWGASQSELGALRKFYGTHEHLFRYNPETQMPEVNTPLLLQYANVQTPNAPAQPTPEARTPQGSDNFDLQQLEENPQEAILTLVKSALGKELDDRLGPLQRSIAADRYDSWSGWMRSQYADYDKWEKKIYGLADELGVNLDSKQKFERFYRMAKADGGGYVDRETALQELQKYRGSLSVMNAGAGDSIMGPSSPSESEASVDDLIGLNSAKYSDQDKGTIRALFKKDMLAPD